MTLHKDMNLAAPTCMFYIITIAAIETSYSNSTDHKLIYSAYIVGIHLCPDSEYEVLEVGLLKHIVVVWGVLVSKFAQLLGGAAKNLRPSILETGHPLAVRIVSSIDLNARRRVRAYIPVNGVYILPFFLTTYNYSYARLAMVQTCPYRMD